MDQFKALLQSMADAIPVSLKPTTPVTNTVSLKPTTPVTNNVPRSTATEKAPSIATNSESKNWLDQWLVGDGLKVGGMG